MPVLDVLIIIGIIIAFISILTFIILYLKVALKRRWYLIPTSTFIISLLLIFIPLSINYTDKNFPTRDDSSFVTTINNNEFETSLYELTKKEFNKDNSDILNYIPSSLLKEEGEKYYLGNKYGFYINTTSSLESDILIFSIDVSLENGYLEDNFNTINISITKEISNKYKYINDETIEFIEEIDNYYLGNTSYYLGIKDDTNLEDKFIFFGEIGESGRYSNISNANYNSNFHSLNIVSTNGTFNIDKENNVNNIELGFKTRQDVKDLKTSIKKENYNYILFRPNKTAQNSSYGGLVKEFSFNATYQDQLLVNESNASIYLEYTSFSDIKDIIVGINLDILFDNSERVNFNSFNRGEVINLASFSRYYTLDEF